MWHYKDLKANNSDSVWSCQHLDLQISSLGLHFILSQDFVSFAAIIRRVLFANRQLLLEKGHPFHGFLSNINAEISGNRARTVP